MLGEFLVIITDALYSNAGMDTPLNPREGLVPPFMQWWNRNLLTKRQRAVRAFLRAFIAFIGMMLLWVGLFIPRCHQSRKMGEEKKRKRKRMALSKKKRRRRRREMEKEEGKEEEEVGYFFPSHLSFGLGSRFRSTIFWTRLTRSLRSAT